MSGVRYFYAGPLEAGWMVDQHGFWVVEEGGFIHNEFESILDSHIQYCYRGKYYVHSDSLPLLEPKKGDIVHAAYGVYGEVECVYVSGSISIDRGIDQAGQRTMLVDVDKNCLKQIIQRNGKAFHWPISEGA